MFLDENASTLTVEEIRNYIETGQASPVVSISNDEKLQELLVAMKAALEEKSDPVPLIVDFLYHVCGTEDISLVDSKLMALKEFLDASSVTSDALLQSVLDACDLLKENQLDYLVESVLILPFPGDVLVKLIRLMHNHSKFTNQRCKLALLLMQKLSTTFSTLLNDIMTDDLELFYDVIPDLYHNFESPLSGDFDSLKLVLSRIDPLIVKIS